MMERPGGDQSPSILASILAGEQARTQMEDAAFSRLERLTALQQVIQDQAEQGKLMKPGFYKAFAEFTDPNTPPERASELAIALGQAGLPTAMQTRQSEITKKQEREAAMMQATDLFNLLQGLSLLPEGAQAGPLQGIQVPKTVVPSITAGAFAQQRTETTTASKEDIATKDRAQREAHQKRVDEATDFRNKVYDRSVTLRENMREDQKAQFDRRMEYLHARMRNELFDWNDAQKAFAWAQSGSEDPTAAEWEQAGYAASLMKEILTDNPEMPVGEAWQAAADRAQITPGGEGAKKAAEANKQRRERAGSKQELTQEAGAAAAPATAPAEGTAPKPMTVEERLDLAVAAGVKNGTIQDTPEAKAAARKRLRELLNKQQGGGQ